MSTIIAGEAGSIFEEFIRSGKVNELADPHQIAGLKAMLDLPSTEYLRAMRVRTLVKAAFHDLFLNCDMVLAPTRLGPAGKAAEPLDATGPPTQLAGRSDSRRESGGFAGDLAALRIRGRIARGDFAAGAAVLGESADRHRPIFFRSRQTGIGGDRRWRPRRPLVGSRGSVLPLNRDRYGAA